MLVTARLDTRLEARIVRRTSLLYARGADSEQDRPAHVRAASSIVRFGGELVIVQDDALFLAHVAVDGGPAKDVLLPWGQDNKRLFDDQRGNKAHKLDLEAAAVVRHDGREILLVLGSGSTPARQSIVVVPFGDEPRVVDASALYEALRADKAFSGSELNIEGAVVQGEELLLLQRGNGASIGDVEAADSTGRLEIRGLLHYLEGGGAPPPLCDVHAYRLGMVGAPEVRLTFTDATVHAGRIVYVAAAEASPDATRDGPVAGVALGVLERDAARYTLVLDEAGIPSTDKIEGIVSLDDQTLIAVVDRDDPDLPAELLHVQFANA